MLGVLLGFLLFPFFPLSHIALLFRRKNPEIQF